MGQLVAQTIPSFFQGVSRQPPEVRLPGQVNEADNAWFSVVSGGFTTRPGSQFVSLLNGLPTPDEDYTVHFYARDAAEQYIVLIGNGWIKVFDLAGNEKTVNLPDGVFYLTSSSPASDYSVATIVDYTFITNRSVATAMGTTLAPSRQPEALIHFHNTYGIKNFHVTVAGVYAGVTYTGADARGDQVAYDVRAALFNNGLSSTDFVITRYGNTLHIYRVDGADFTLSYKDDAGNIGAVAFKDKIQSAEDLPAVAVSGYIVEVTGSPNTDQDSYWMKYVDEFEGWVETVKPGTPLGFDPATMPHVLIRETDGSFTFKRATWNDRVAGDDTTSPPPDFIGYPIEDIVFHRSRLGFLADEAVYFSRVDDYFNFWPESVSEVTDADPFGRVSPEKGVNKLMYGESFQKVLFVTSDRTQFELSSDSVFSPKQAKIEPSTRYATDVTCRPYAHGKELYFAARAGSKASIFEYYYDDSTLNNVAVDVTKHVEGYVPGPLKKIVGDTVNDILFVKSEADPRSLYIYQVFWNGDTKAQSAWSKWLFDCVVKDHFVYDSHLWIVGLFDDGTTRLLKVRLDLYSSTDTFPIPVRLDSRVEVAGVYDAGTNTTTFTLPFSHGDAVRAVCSTDFTTEAGRELALSYSQTDTTKVSVVGDLSGGRVIVGLPVEMRVVLSPIYVREGEPPRARATGRLQLKRLYLNYESSGPFDVDVAPKARSTKTYRMTANRIGDVGTQIGELYPSDSGVFAVRVVSRADTTTIAVRSVNHVPVTITGARWVGFFNDLSK